MAAVADEILELFLTQCGLAWSIIPWQQHVSLNNEWETLYGNFHHWLRKKQGAKAQFEYSHQSAEKLMIVPFLGNVAGPHSINKRGPRKAAYECRGNGAVPDLSSFANTDFFIVPDDFSWTMIHTHEDYGLGGPYFIRKEWLDSPTRGQGRLLDSAGPRWYCPLLKRDIEQGLCLDINFQRLKYCKPDVLKDAQQETGKTFEEISSICEACPNQPLRDE